MEKKSNVVREMEQKKNITKHHKTLQKHHRKIYKPPKKIDIFLDGLASF